MNEKLKPTKKQEEENFTITYLKAWGMLIGILGIMFLISIGLGKLCNVSPWPFFIVMFIIFIGGGLLRFIRGKK
uniref:Uncharacterized protein n=1 Tax=viral metagenome TaxID=1070528 RepID=A0A6H1ZIZ6_9ZZZZ